MSFIPDSKIQDTESLYRAFHYLEWNFKENRPNSEVFKSSSPLSVDRDGERNENDILIGFRSRKNFDKCGLVKHTAKTYRDYNTEPIPNPEESNIYHALVNGKGMIGTKKSHAKKLSKSAILVFHALI
uniref:Uncharacterized protein n=1 Tax=Ignavibacterium album TaxID=591197 RepID=A0A7V2ZLB1_9BACT